MRKVAKKKISLNKLKQLRFQVILKRDNFQCVRCQTTTGLSPAHIYPTGRYPRMAWMTINILTLCWFRCHDWWHKHPLESAEWFKQKYPGRAERLKELSKQDLPAIDHNKIKTYLEQFI
jgi:hypothetical protein